MRARATRSALALPLSTLGLMRLMSLPPIRKEWVLLAVKCGSDSLTQFGRFCQEVIKPSQDATEAGVRRILSRHITNYCNWYSINYGLVAPRLRSTNLGVELRRGRLYWALKPSPTSLFPVSRVQPPFGIAVPQAISMPASAPKLRPSRSG